MQFINVLDMRTLLVGNVTCLLVCVIVMAVAWRHSHNRFPAIAYWLRCIAMQFTGMSLIVLRGAIPDLFSIVLAGALIIGGINQLYAGLKLYLGKPGSQWLNRGFLAVFLLIHVYFTYVRPSLPHRGVNYAVFLALISAQCSWLMLFRVGPDKRFGTALVGAVTGGYVVLNIGRLGYYLIASPAQDSLGIGAYDAALYLVYQLLAIALTFSLVLMVNRRLHVELENDMRQLARSEDALRVSEDRLARAELAAKSGNWELNLNSGIVVGSAGAAKVYGVEVDRLDLAAIKAIPLPECRPLLDAALSNLILNGGPYDVEFRIRAVDTGEIKDIRSFATFDPEKRIVFGVIQDVTDRKAIERKLERLAQIDPLTGVFNRRHFMLLSEKELARANRYESALSVLMLDIDHFKRVNDTHGHQAGDRVLRALGEIFRGILREMDFVGRIGGEEFAVVLPQTAIGQAIEVAERLRRAVEQTGIPLEHGLPLIVSVSIGAASLSSPNTNIDTMLGNADKALYAAKNEGRDCVRAFAEDRPDGR